MDLRCPWISLRNLWIHTLRRNPWIAQESVDRAGFNLPIYRFFIPTLPKSHFYELLLLDKLQYVIGELFSKYQPGTKRTCLIVILRQLHAVTPCSTLLRRRQSVILFRRLSRLVEVANRSIYMSAPTRDCYSEMICILRKIHRLRKHPWISAQTMDPQIAQADPWIAQIHRLRPT